MRTDDLLLDALGRVRDLVPAVLDGLDETQLAHRPGGTSNPIGWLVWHLARVQDDHLADALGGGREHQVWLVDGWERRFALDLPAEDTGYGHTSDEVDRVRASAELLAGYHAAVARRSEELVRGLGDDDLDRVVDEAWDPPVTLGVRLMSVVSDCLQHVGQAAAARGPVTAPDPG